MKKIKRVFVCFSLLLGVIANTYCQSNVVAVGGVARGNGGIVSYSVGQVDYISLSGKGGTVIEGVQQTGSPAMPVSLLQLEVAATNKKEVVINWSILAEHNNQYFTVERSKDGELFTDLSTKQSISNANIKHTYQIIDALPQDGTSFYRLKQTDIAGKTIYSNIAAVTMPLAETSLKAYPNPTTSILNLQVSDAATKQLTYTIYSIDGNQLAQQKISNDLTIIPTASLIKGTYILQVSNHKTIIQSFKIIKN